MKVFDCSTHEEILIHKFMGAEARQVEAHEEGVCPVAKTAEIISGKWTLLIVRDLAEGPKRFNELEHSLRGISPRTLSARLKALEAKGIIHRECFAEIPPRVEYTLTEKGQDLLAILESMRCFWEKWGDREESSEPICDIPK